MKVTSVTHVEEVEEDDQCMRKLVTCAEVKENDAGALGRAHKT